MIPLSHFYLVPFLLAVTESKATRAGRATTPISTNATRAQEQRIPLKKPPPDHRQLRQSSAARIVGGTNAAVGAFPFFAWWQPMNCGASLVAPDILLTAPHCSWGNDQELGIVTIAGSHSVQRGQGHTYSVIQAWIHPSFNYDYYREPEWDFMLLQINETVPASMAKPVALNADANRPRVGDWITAVGFGLTAENAEDNPTLLQQVDLPYIEYNACLEYWGQFTLINSVAELCYMHPSKDGGYDTCFGDSGGPLLIPLFTDIGSTGTSGSTGTISNCESTATVTIIAAKSGSNSEITGATNTSFPAGTTEAYTTTAATNRNNNNYNPDYLQVGVVSWGDDGCAKPSIPSIGSRLSSAVDWIHPQVCINTKATTKPDFCQSVQIDLPMSLRVEIFTTRSLDTRPLNISWGLYQIEPPQTLYEVDERGIIHANRTASTVSVSRASSGSTANNNGSQKQNNNIHQQQENRQPDPTVDGMYRNNRDTFFFDNLQPGFYYFRLNPLQQPLNNPQDFFQVDRIQVIQAGRRMTKDSMIHAWVDLDGTVPLPTSGASSSSSRSSSSTTKTTTSSRNQDDQPSSLSSSPRVPSFYSKYIDLQPSMSIMDLTLPLANIWQHDYVGVTVELSVDVFYDSNPQETAWEIRKLNDQAEILMDTGNANPVVHLTPMGNVTTPGLQTYSFHVPAHANHQYQFHIWDQAGNGMCCNNDGVGNGVHGSGNQTTATTTSSRNGWVQLWLSDHRQPRVIWHFNGTFAYEYKHIFYI